MTETTTGSSANSLALAMANPEFAAAVQAAQPRQFWEPEAGEHNFLLVGAVETPTTYKGYGSQLHSDDTPATRYDLTFQLMDGPEAGQRSFRPFYLTDRFGRKNEGARVDDIVNLIGVFASLLDRSVDEIKADLPGAWDEIRASVNVAAYVIATRTYPKKDKAGQPTGETGKGHDIKRRLAAVGSPSTPA